MLETKSFKMEKSTPLNDDFFSFAPPFEQEQQEVDPLMGIRAKHKQAYFQLVRSYQTICRSLKAGKLVDGNMLKDQIAELISFIKEDERMLIGLANSPYSFILKNLDEEIYSVIVIHGINVMIYSLKISIDLGVPDLRLPYIGAAALYHRLGLLDLDEKELVSKNIDAPFLNVIENFDQNPEKYINMISFDDFHTESIQYLITLVKEDQQILQKTSLREAMYQYSMVIHLCYQFEKLTHHQLELNEVLSPIDAMKTMRDDMADHFHPDIVKLFFNKLSIYPLGTFVKLSSLETAKIVSINEQSLLRPIVMIVLDEDGVEKLDPVRVNLREKPNLYIKRAVVDEFLTEKYIDLF